MSSSEISPAPGPLDHLRSELAAMAESGSLLKIRTLEREQAARTRFDGREVVNLASNNYLGLAAHPRLRIAAAQAALEFGAGSAAVRTIAGTMTLHRTLEDRLAAFKDADSAILFQSGFTANAGCVGAILGKDDVIVSDQLNHASIIDGARLSRATIKVFPHKDVAAAEELLRESSGARCRLLITDGVFSMDGDIAPLPHLVEIAERHGAVMMIDDAHASGVLGKGGRGTVAHFGLQGRVDIQVGTLSKALGSLGGYIAGPRHLYDFLTNRGRPFLFSTSHPPAVCAAALAALEVLEDEPERIDRLWANTNRFHDGLHAMGFDTGASETPITPVIIGEDKAAAAFAAALWDRDVFCPAIVFPTVPKGKARVRAIVTAAHSEADLDRALEAFEAAGRAAGLLG